MSLLVPDLKDLAVRYIVRNITVVSKTSGSQAVEDASARPLDRPGIQVSHRIKAHESNLQINNSRASLCKSVSVIKRRFVGKQRTIDERPRRMVHGCKEWVKATVY
jgi:hypothetical protein